MMREIARQPTTNIRLAPSGSVCQKIERNGSRRNKHSTQSSLLDGSGDWRPEPHLVYMQCRRCQHGFSALSRRATPHMAS